MAPPDRPPPPLEPRRPRPHRRYRWPGRRIRRHRRAGARGRNPISRGTVLSTRLSNSTPPSGDGACACGRTGCNTQIAAVPIAHARRAVRCMACRSTVARACVRKPEPGTSGVRVVGFYCDEVLLLAFKMSVPRDVALEPILLEARTPDRMRLAGIDDQFGVAATLRPLIQLLAADDRHVNIVASPPSTSVGVTILSRRTGEIFHPRLRVLPRQAEFRFPLPL